MEKAQVLLSYIVKALQRREGVLAIKKLVEDRIILEGGRSLSEMECSILSEAFWNALFVIKLCSS
jgi:hypothetical protein